MSEPVLVPGARDVRASLDGDSDGGESVVVAAPPHPQHRGHRGDERLRAVSDALVAEGIDCLRFDYGEWDEGYGERSDCERAVGWARERYERVGLFGFSFGGAIALLTAAESAVDCVSALAPASRLNADVDAAAAIERIDCPIQVVYGARDDTADWKPVVEAAERAGAETVEFGADHFFVGQSAKVGETVGAWLAARLR